MRLQITNIFQEPFNLINTIKKRRIPLRGILLVPFLLEITLAVGLTGWFSIQYSERAIRDLAFRAAEATNTRIDRYLDNYLTLLPQLNRLNLDAQQMGWLNFQDFDRLAEHFIWQMRTYSVGYINFGTPEGDYIGVERLEDGSLRVIQDPRDGKPGHETIHRVTENGAIGELITIQTDYDHRLEAWYADAAAVKQPIWSEIYAWEDKPSVLSISSSYPVYDENGRFLGILGVDRILTRIDDFLQSIDANYDGVSFTTFILERNGTVVASSTPVSHTTSMNGNVVRLSAFESPDPQIRAVSQQLRDRFGRLNAIDSSQQLKLTIDGEPQFVRVSPWQDELGLDWLTVAIVPERAFLGQIRANARTTGILCLLALIVATILGVLSSRWIAKPLYQLAEASDAMARGDLQQSLEMGEGSWRIREVSVLTQSFQDMAVRLKTAFDRLQNTNSELEDRVRHRTRELEAAKQAADTANQAKSEFLANMSHELRTPLNGILGYAQILKRTPQNEKQRQGIDVIFQCGSHLLTLINDILDLSKIEARKMELRPSEFHFPSFLTAVSEICQIRAQQKGLTWNYRFNTPLPEGVRADEKRLRQVLINLLGNAVKYTSRGSVTFDVSILENFAATDDRPAAAKVRFQVEDTGIGMNAQQLQGIFEPFEQLEQNHREIEGTGLGLAIARSIVGLMDSQIHVRSQVGQGSTFWFDVVLPLAREWTLSAVARYDNVVGYDGDRRTLLVVDDKLENRAVIRNLLEPLGFEIVEACDGADALAKLDEPFNIAQGKGAIDVVLTDLVMPGIDGFELIQRLRAEPRWQSLPILVSSASVFDEDRQQSLDIGGNDFLPKPVRAEELLDMLQRLLQLQWQYAETGESQSSAATKSVPNQALVLSRVEEGEAFTPPTTEELQQLLDWAKRGNLKRIRTWSEQAIAQQRSYTPFAQQLLQLAVSFQDRAILEVLQHHAPVGCREDG